MVFTWFEICTAYWRNSNDAEMHDIDLNVNVFDIKTWLHFVRKISSIQPWLALLVLYSLVRMVLFQYWIYIDPIQITIACCRDFKLRQTLQTLHLHLSPLDRYNLLVKSHNIYSFNDIYVNSFLVYICNLVISLLFWTLSLWMKLCTEGMIIDILIQYN